MNSSAEFSLADIINALWLLTLWLALPLAAGLLLHRHSMRGERGLLRVAILSAPLAVFCGLWFAPNTTALFQWSSAAPAAAVRSYAVLFAPTDDPRTSAVPARPDDRSLQALDEPCEDRSGPCVSAPEDAFVDSDADSLDPHSVQLFAQLTPEQAAELFGSDTRIAAELDSGVELGLFEITIPTESLRAASEPTASAPRVDGARDTHERAANAPTPAVADRDKQTETLFPSAPLSSPTDGSGDAGLAITHGGGTFASRALLGLWCVAAAWILLRLLAAHVALRRIRDAWQPVDADFVATARTLAERVGYRRRFGVFTARRLAEAVASGWLRPAVAIPSAWLARLSRRDIEPLLLHEIAHLKHRDPLWRSIAWFCSAVLWPHPLLHWLVRREQRLSEEVADELTLAAGADRRHYAQLLGKLATEREFSALPSLASGTFGPRTHLEGRIRMILTQATRPTGRGGWARTTFVCLACLALLGLAVAHPLVGSAQANDDARYQVEVRSQDGWWIGEGRAPGADGKVVWTVRLAPTAAGVPARIEHSGTTAIVRVGNREWTIGADTGQAKERVARTAPSSPSNPFVTAPDLPAATAPCEVTTPVAALPCPPEPSSDPFASSPRAKNITGSIDPLGRYVDLQTRTERQKIELQQRELTDRLRVMEERLARAKLLEGAGTISSHELEEAELALGAARTNLKLLEIELAAPTPAPSLEPLMPCPPYPPAAAAEPTPAYPPTPDDCAPPRPRAPKSAVKSAKAARELAQKLATLRSTHELELKRALTECEAAVDDLSSSAAQATSMDAAKAAYEMAQKRAHEVHRLWTAQRSLRDTIEKDFRPRAQQARDELQRSLVLRQRDHERASHTARRTIEQRLQQLEEELQKSREEHQAAQEQLQAEHERQLHELERQLQRREREFERAMRQIQREQERSLKQNEQDVEEQSLEHEGLMNTFQEISEESASIEEEVETSTRERIEALEQELKQLHARLRHAARAAQRNQAAEAPEAEFEAIEQDAAREADCDDMGDGEEEEEVDCEEEDQGDSEEEEVTEEPEESPSDSARELELDMNSRYHPAASLTPVNLTNGVEASSAAEQAELADLAREIAFIRETVQLVKESVKEKLRLRAPQTER
ncbi:MAG: M56 family metallopeptidase [Planctomycetota bacterium]